MSEKDNFELEDEDKVDLEKKLLLSKHFHNTFYQQLNCWIMLDISECDSKEMKTAFDFF